MQELPLPTSLNIYLGTFYHITISVQNELPLLSLVLGLLLSHRNKLGLDFVCVDSTICMCYAPELNTPASPQAAQLWVSSHRHQGVGFSISFSELHQAQILHPACCSTSVLNSICSQPTISTCNNAKPSKSQDHLNHCFPSYEEILLYAFSRADGR